MPFAPILRKKDAPRYLKISNKVDYKFMTFTLNCKQLMLKHAPAAVHVDKTARPQIISKIDNPRLHKIISEYEKITGVPILINTSFNVRGEPIVRTPFEALRCFANTKIDFLVIENYLVSKEKQNSLDVLKDNYKFEED